jgi:sulfur carrier protein
MSDARSNRVGGPGKGGEIVVLVNGETTAIPGECTLTELLVQLEMQSHRVAVAHNREVVHRTHYDAVALHAGDRIEILEAVGGG